MKYSKTEYSTDESFDESLRNKISDFQNVTKCKYAINPVLVTTYGLLRGKYSGNIQGVITTDDLFRF